MVGRRGSATIATRVYPPEVTAASFRMQAAATALAAKDDVTVLTTTPPLSAGVAGESIGVTSKRLPALRDRGGAIRGYLQYLSFDIPLFFRLLRTGGDVVVAEAPPTTGLVSLVACRLRRMPLVYYPGDVWTDAVIAMGGPKPVIAVMRRLETFIIRGARRVLAVSPEVAQRIIEMGADEDAVVMVGNGIDTQIFRPDVQPMDTVRPYFVYTGTMSEWQEPGVFIRALARLDADVEIRFFGQGAVEDELRAVADRVAPGRVHFGGVVSPAESARWIRGAVASLVSIVPGIGYDFARPTKTYAAAACGVPVLFAGAETGGRVVRDGGLGEAIAFDDKDVAAAMGRLLAAFHSGESERRVTERVRWIQENASLAAVGERAARAVREAADGTATRER